MGLAGRAHCSSAKQLSVLTHAMQTQLPPQPLLPAHLQLLPELAPWAGWDLPTACHSLQCRAGTPQLLYSAAKCPPCSELAPGGPWCAETSWSQAAGQTLLKQRRRVEGWTRGHRGSSPCVPAQGTPQGLSPAAGPTGSSHS